MLPAAARRRPASVALAALIASTFLFVLFGLFLWIGVVRVAKAEGRRAADAASIAAAVRLADNRVLTGDLTVLTDADASAQAVAAPNLIYGRPPVIAPFVNNDPNGDVLFGTVDPAQPRGMRFTPGPNPITTPAQLAAVNAVGVRTNGTVGGCPNDDGSVCGGRRIGPTAVAWFDTAVFGFRPVNLPNLPTAADPRTPVLPVALYENTANAARTSWSQRGTIMVGGTVPTVTVAFGPPAPGQVRAVTLSVGGANPFDFLIRQIGTGITGADLAGMPYNGQLVLPVPPADLFIPAGTPVAGNAQALADAFTALPATRTVVFPLFDTTQSGFDPPGQGTPGGPNNADCLDNGGGPGPPVQPPVGPPGQGNGPPFLIARGCRARLTGFVSARVAAVRLTVGGQVELDLTPTRFQTPSALTDPARYNPDTRTYQPVVGRVRIAE